MDITLNSETKYLVWQPRGPCGSDLPWRKNVPFNYWCAGSCQPPGTSPLGSITVSEDSAGMQRAGKRAQLVSQASSWLPWRNQDPFALSSLPSLPSCSPSSLGTKSPSPGACFRLFGKGLLLGGPPLEEPGKNIVTSVQTWKHPPSSPRLPTSKLSSGHLGGSVS
ncbi:uncharacterized protein LOC111561823 isoform X3 [Felis catus]|uniref:uncharacterized protein LOC111561823 isoform X3 n=1 Tax=Felis catus TaxID=9685 RepID=UPI001D1A14A3|nr:uncharacterized protein LOC111561823 isoform X3 [Felis catus]